MCVSSHWTGSKIKSFVHDDLIEATARLLKIMHPSPLSQQCQTLRYKSLGKHQSIFVETPDTKRDVIEGQRCLWNRKTNASDSIKQDVMKNQSNDTKPILFNDVQ